MYVPPWAIITAIVVIAVQAYIALRSRPASVPKPPHDTSDQQPARATQNRPPTEPLPSVPPHVPKIERLHQNLRLKTGYNEQMIQRMIQFERERLPWANMENWMEAAIVRWERENR